MPRETARGQHPGRIPAMPKKTIYQVRTRVLRRPYNRPKESQDDGDQPPPQRPSRHQQCDGCIPCKISGKNIKPNLHNTEKKQLPALNKPNEEIQLDFIGPFTEKNQRFLILLSMDRSSKWPAASLCKSTDGETTVKFMEQYINLNGIPKTIRTDKATAFTGHTFREFCKNHHIRLIYGTPYIHTPTGLV